MLGDNMSMRAFCAQLIKRHRVVLVDPPGFGANNTISQWPDIYAQAAIAHEIVDALGLERFHWVGHGYGGLIGTILAGRVGYRIGSFTLSSVPYVRANRIKIMSELVTSLLYGSHYGRALIARRLSAQIATASPAERALTHQQVMSTQTEGNVGVVRRARAIPQTVLNKLRIQLVGLNVPKLVLAGRVDNLVLPRDQRTFAEVLNARYFEVDSGFMTFLAQPEECARQVLAFWADNPRPALD